MPKGGLLLPEGGPRLGLLGLLVPIQTDSLFMAYGSS